MDKTAALLVPDQKLPSIGPIPRLPAPKEGDELYRARERVMELATKVDPESEEMVEAMNALQEIERLLLESTIAVTA